MELFQGVRESVWQFKLIGKFVRWVFPEVDGQLEIWRTKIQGCPEPNLAEQALASIKSKRFHCLGGSIYALYPGIASSKDAASLIAFIVALQTISDYLDNLCDRAGCLDEQAFRQLHLAMTEALTPQGELSAYYDLYPYQDDGDYLGSLVEVCRKELRKLPSYAAVHNHALELAGLYSELQTYKHVELHRREKLLGDWAQKHLDKYPQLSCWEFAAATGSTLGMFMLVAAAFKRGLSGQEAEQIKQAYFPWICGLHILLDYFIDQEEDRQEQDFNFVAYYEDEAQCLERLQLFWTKSKERALGLPNPHFHLTVIEGLLAMYLSDPKARVGKLKTISTGLLQTAGPRAQLLYKACLALRAKNKI